MSKCPFWAIGSHDAILTAAPAADRDTPAECCRAITMKASAEAEAAATTPSETGTYSCGHTHAARSAPAPSPIHESSDGSEDTESGCVIDNLTTQRRQLSLYRNVDTGGLTPSVALPRPRVSKCDNEGLASGALTIARCRCSGQEKLMRAAPALLVGERKALLRRELVDGTLFHVPPQCSVPSHDQVIFESRRPGARPISRTRFADVEGSTRKRGCRTYSRSCPPSLSSQSWWESKHSPNGRSREYRSSRYPEELADGFCACPVHRIGGYSFVRCSWAH